MLGHKGKLTSFVAYEVVGYGSYSAEPDKLYVEVEVQLPPVVELVGITLTEGTPSMSQKWMASAKGCTGSIEDTPEQAALQFFAQYPAWRKKTVVVRSGVEKPDGIFVTDGHDSVFDKVTYEMALAGLSREVLSLEAAAALIAQLGAPEMVVRTDMRWGDAVPIDVRVGGGCRYLAVTGGTVAELVAAVRAASKN